MRHPSHTPKPFVIRRPFLCSGPELAPPADLHAVVGVTCNARPTAEPLLLTLRLAGIRAVALAAQTRHGHSGNLFHMLRRAYSSHRRQTTSHRSRAESTRHWIDIGRALDLLDAAVDAYGASFVYPPVDDPERDCLYRFDDGPLTIAAHALRLVGVRDADLERLRHQPLRELHAQGSLPVRLSLGAAVVLDAAQRSQDRGRSCGEALEDAAKVAQRYIALLPDRALAAVSAPEPAPVRRTYAVRRCTATG
jgi:hypothetical protein